MFNFVRIYMNNSKYDSNNYQRFVLDLYKAFKFSIIIQYLFILFVVYFYIF